MNCASCAYEAESGAAFCERCGEPFPQSAPAAGPPPAAGATAVGATAAGATPSSPTPEPAPPTPDPSAQARPCSCGAPAEKIDAQGVCTVCGQMQGAAGRDHFDVCLDAHRAADTDIGQHHWRNEDYVAMASAPDGTVFVVSDGVSSSEHPDQASEAASKAAVKAVLDLSGKPRAAVEKAIEAAQAAVLEIKYDPNCGKAPPEATLLVAYVRGNEATLGWIGDTRAYAVKRDGAVTLLTQDHSWVNWVVSLGQMSLHDALEDRRAHAITQSLGELPDGEMLEPSFRTIPLDGVRYLIGCSDGFWNYAHPQQDQPPQPMIALLAEDAPDALTLAKRCVAFANAQGGHDNITVAVVELPV